MDFKTQQELLAKLDALSAKLGAGAQYLYSLAVRQAYINGCEYIVLAVVAVCAARYFYKKIAVVKESYDYDLQVTALGVATALTSGASILFTISAIDCLANPYFTAFQAIAEKLK